MKTKEGARLLVWNLYWCKRNEWRGTFNQCTGRRARTAEGKHGSLQHAFGKARCISWPTGLSISGKSEFPLTTSTVVLFGKRLIQAYEECAITKKDVGESAGDGTTVFVLDEFRTSKMCPGGCGAVMEHVGDGGYRMRRC